MQLRQLLLQYEIENNIKHDEAAKRIGIGRATYFRWLKGESTHLKANTLKKLSDMLDCDVKSILDEEERIKPIVGSVKAGYDGFPMEDIEGYIELNRHDGKKGDYFLRVRGDSMINAHIYEGDLVFVKQTNEVESGSIAIVLVGEEATLKRVLYKKGLMILEAANPKIDTKVFTPEEVEELPVKAPKKARKVENRTVLVIQDGTATAIRRRPPEGLLAGLYEIPNMEGHLTQKEALTQVKNIGLEPLRIEPLPDAKHIFSHIEWHMNGYLIRIDETAPDGKWLFADIDELDHKYAIPTAYQAYRKQIRKKLI